MIARQCDRCEQRIAQPADEYLELTIRVMDATGSESQDCKDQQFGDFCDDCVRGGFALEYLLNQLRWRLGHGRRASEAEATR